MKDLLVSLTDNRSYPIMIGQGLLQNGINEIASLIQTRDVVVVTNATIAPLYIAKVNRFLDVNALRLRTQIVLPDGEVFKNWQTLQLIFDGLVKSHAERGTALIALGGGVIGDLTGFAAACYQRGIPFIQIPTTLLAQVDSSVGGKTGINHPNGKNLIGAFYQPKLVLMDIDTLNTLEGREFQAGLAEVIKYGLVRDLPFFNWIEENIDGVLKRDPQLLEYLVYQSCLNKVEVVTKDEREAGERALLNFGHTFGHAIEAGLGYGTWLHGEAVAAGMVMAVELSKRLGWLTQHEIDRVKDILSKLSLPIRVPKVKAELFLQYMQYDKKVIDSKLRFILLKKLGQGVVFSDVSESMLYDVIAASSF